MKNDKKLSIICSFCFAANLILFFIKLYTALCSNSIVIFSDAVNSAADSVCCLVSAACFLIFQSLEKNRLAFAAQRARSLLSLSLSAVILAVGLSFCYYALERLMYPTPIWFEVRYFYLLLFTAAAKLLMYFALGAAQKRLGGSVLGVIKADSLSDFAVTLAAVLSFALAQRTVLSLDAFCALAVGALITVNAARLLVKSARSVLGLIDKGVQKEVTALAESVFSEQKIDRIVFFPNEDGSAEMYIHLSERPPYEREREFMRRCETEHKIYAYIITK